MAMTMSRITDCEVIECSYNKDRKCHTPAITVGDTSCPMCDTFTRQDQKGGDPQILGGVGACRADDCKFNESLECRANGISVGMHSNHADCKTYSTR